MCFANKTTSNVPIGDFLNYPFSFGRKVSIKQAKESEFVSKNAASPLRILNRKRPPAGLCCPGTPGRKLGGANFEIWWRRAKNFVHQPRSTRAA